MLHQILLNSQPPVALAILPGGKNWPLLSLGEDGRIYAGSQVIEATIGNVVAQSEATFVLPYDVEVTALIDGYRLRQKGKECQLSAQTLQLDAHKTPLQALQDYNLIMTSSDVANDNEIWLAAILPDATPSPYLLVYSNDAGEHWRNLVEDGPLLAKVPAAWLEGQRRRVAQP